MDEPIKTVNLTKNFNGFRALDNLDIAVRRNSFLGFLGPNGAGKTTTIKILTNLLSPSSGSAYVNGINVTEDPKGALTDLGTVVETPEFYPYLTPKETLSYLGELQGMNNDDIRTRTAEVLDMVKMSEWGNKRIGKFSKGMKQRIAIAQAILHRPSVVILDEPTSGLDPRGMFEVREILTDLKKEDYTILMSSHLLNEVQQVCDDVVLINKGKLLKSGPVDALIASADLRRLEVRTYHEATDVQLRRISQLNAVSDLEPIGPRDFVLSVVGGDEAQVNLLEELQNIGLKVVTFKESGASLENLYMSLIKDSR
jgi:ABC-2 type transport system ATP-binding protein